MERELFALWQSVTSHEKMIRGLLTFVYIDHKNNLFVRSMLDNRRIAKKVSNWALELQCFNIVRIWIRGEANILSDAPSRAPWENELAKHLVIPDDPVRQLIKDLYGEDLGAQDRRYDELESRAPEWRQINRGDDRLPDFGEFQSGEEYGARPKTGRNTPTFGVAKLAVQDPEGSRSLSTPLPCAGGALPCAGHAGRPDLLYGDDVPMVMPHQGEFGESPAWRLEPRDYEDFRAWLGGFEIAGIHASTIT